MSRTSVRHAYKVVSINVRGEEVQKTGNIEVGGYIVADKHVRKHHEPKRDWSWLHGDLKVGSENPFTVIVGEHIGEYEKVKDYLGGGES